MSEALTALLRRVQRNLRDDVYRNEEAVRSQIVIRVLQELGWGDPKQVRLEHPVGKDQRQKADIALFLPRHRKPSILLELKTVGLVDMALDQLFRYCIWERTEFGVATDGASWRFHLPFEDITEDNNEREVQRFDLTRDSVEHVKQCLTRYLAFSRVKSGAALRAAKRDYQDQIVRFELRKAIPEVLNDVIINDPHSDILKILARKCRKRIETPLRQDVIEEVLRDMEKPNWVWRATPLTGGNESGEDGDSDPRKPRPYRTVIVGEWRKDFNRVTKAQNALFNALVRECGIKILEELVPFYKGNRIQRLAPTKEEIAESGNLARENSSQLHCGWWLSWNTNTKKTDERIKKVIEIARRMRPDLRVEWRPTDVDSQPENGGRPVKPPRTGRAKFRIVVGDTQEDHTTGTDALVALFQAAWKTFGQEVFEAFLEQETQRRGRPWLARTKKDTGLTGKHEISAKEVAPGWWINTNLNQDRKTLFANKLIAITSSAHPKVPVSWEPI